MKTTLQKKGMLIAVLLGSFTASAYDFEVDGIYYNLISPKDLTCEIVQGDVKYEGDFVIPTEVTYNNRVLSVIAINGAFQGCTSLTSVDIPDSVTEIGESAFRECTSLTSVDIPDSVTEIGHYAFKDCSDLTSVTIGKSLNTFGGDNIEGCNSITQLRILHSDHSINLYGNWLNKIKELYIDRPLQENLKFSDLEKLELGESVESFQAKDMHKLDKLTSIESYALVPPKLPEMSNTQYMNVDVFVPEAALEAYKSDPVWGNFWNIEGFEYDGVEDIKSETAHRLVIGRFDLNGRAVSEDYQGLVIVRFSDGSCKKMLNR